MHSPLPAADRAEIAGAVVEIRSIGPRRDIVQRGDRPEHIHVVLSGMACCYRLLQDGGRQIVAFLLPGDLCDLQFTGRMEYSVATLNTCEVALLSREAFQELAQRRGALALALLRVNAIEASTLREWLVAMGHGPAERQMAHLFCELHARFSSLGLTNTRSCSLPLTQNDLADTLGLSLVHANRTIMQLRNRGLITWKGGVLTILDLEALRNFAEFSPDYLQVLPPSFQPKDSSPGIVVRAPYRGSWGPQLLPHSGGETVPPIA
ncbi:Crp/Fnr family transcriptional regulator [Muricoccus radiodurans]|uniref:Crp/Fnr family transcriptional regulator n=1 Tax=Muricoccus radiodurans TaxID=2231721 RepID=UPI003CF059C8